MPAKDGKHVLIAGGGVAALEAMVALRDLAGELVEVELISPDLDFLYRPLSVGEPFGVGDVLRFDLTSLARGAARRIASAPSSPSPPTSTAPERAGTRRSATTPS